MEFALVMPLFLLLVSAVIDYGFYFNNAMSVKQGSREAARMGVVQTAAAGTCASASTDYVRQLACTANVRTGPTTGTAYSKVFYSTWAAGQSLTVCTMVATDAAVGLVPYPSDGWVRSRTDMAIEVASPTPPGTNIHTDALPAGGSWSWCPN